MNQRIKKAIPFLLIAILAFSLVVTGCSSSGSKTEYQSDELNNPDDVRIIGATEASVDQKPATVVIEAPQEVVLQYVSPEQVKADIESEADLFLVDIQPESDFKKHHIQGAIATYAFPVSSNDDKQKLARILPDVLTSDAPIYILCPRGRSGADNTFHFLAEQGVANNRLFIIEGGQAGWPYEELTVSN